MKAEGLQSGLYYLVFSGHRIDAPGRVEPRFPASTEGKASRMIAAAIADEIDQQGAENLRAISSCANGGDILFLEACAAAGVPTEIYLASQEDRFIAASVDGAGPQWIERYRRVCKNATVHVLEDDHDSPLNVYQQTNLWMLDTALTRNTAGVTVMVLWDGAAGDGAGGTRDMVRRAEDAGATVVHLDANELLA